MLGTNENYVVGAPDITPDGPGEWACQTQSDDWSVCTREKDHTGPHAAGNGVTLVAVWGDGAELSAPDSVPIYHMADIEVNPDENDPDDRWVSVYLHDPDVLDTTDDTVRATLMLTADEALELARQLIEAAGGAL